TPGAYHALRRQPSPPLPPLSRPAPAGPQERGGEKKKRGDRRRSLPHPRLRLPCYHGTMVQEGGRRYGSWQDRRSPRRRAGADRGADREAAVEGVEGAGGILRDLPGRSPGGDRAPRLRGQGAVRGGGAPADRGFEEGLRPGFGRHGEPSAQGGIP